MGIRKTINKNKSDYETCVVQNGDTVSIPAGTPVIFKVAGDNTDGFAVVLPSTSTAVKVTSLFAGVLMRTLNVGETGEAAINGFVFSSLVSRGTRSATTAAWPSFAAIALGDQMVIDTVANAFVFSAVGAQSLNAGMAVFADAGQTGASTTTAASNAYTAYSASTSYNVPAKMILRNM